MTISLWRVATATLLAAGLVSVVGCSSDAGTPAPTPSAPTSSAPTPSSAAPEDQRTGAAQVASGLRKIDQIAKDIVAAGTDTAKAKTLIAQIEPQWKPIEGTVKANSTDTYLAMEDSFAQLAKAADGDAATAVKGATTVAGTVAAYLAKYPG
ncbi:MAG TPA: hypothetical protein VLJ59_12790 [Mycobacteriales bacterium]|nr:hypothetical protein [Mycobacteriales bacterium]